MADVIREQLGAVLDWKNAHADLDAAVAGLDPALRGVRPAGLPYSIWEEVEHIRIALHDIWDFCVNPKYAEHLRWPDDYWPPTAAPPNDDAWDASLAEIRADIAAMKGWALDPSTDLAGRVPWGSGQTNVREILVAADHAAYHVGQIVLLRRLLGAWPTQG